MQGSRGSRPCSLGSISTAGPDLDRAVMAAIVWMVGRRRKDARWRSAVRARLEQYSLNSSHAARFGLHIEGLDAQMLVGSLGEVTQYLDGTEVPGLVSYLQVGRRRRGDSYTHDGSTV